jgi:vacuolar ATPase assembly integral membrane protein VMA21
VARASNTLTCVFGLGNATYSGAFAAIMANVVLVAYIIVAMREDQSDRIEAEEKLKKAQ